MKSLIKLNIVLAMFSTAVFADVMQDFDTLGGNKTLLERAKDLNPESKVEVVQDRIVSRKNRFELSPQYGTSVGGDTFLSTARTGLAAHFHFNHRWSLGVKHNIMSNVLSKDGENLINDTKLTGKAVVPDLDYPKSETMGLIAWYPIYGKINLFDKGIAHFDVYGQLGAGSIELNSGSTSTYLAGLGVGFWLSQHLTSRLELNMQNYKSQRKLGESDMTLTIASFSLGYML